MAGTYLAQGIILKRRDHREADRVVTLYTDRYGKIDAIARGARKITSKLASHLEPMSYSSLMLAEGRQFDVLATSVRLSSFRLPQSDVASFVFASYFFEAVDRLTRNNFPDPELFRLLVDFLEHIENGTDGNGGSHASQRLLITLYFTWRLIEHLGFAPRLDHCVTGKESLAGKDVHLTADKSGFVCTEHRGNDDHREPLDRQSSELLRLMHDGALAPLLFTARRSRVVLETAGAIDGFVTYHLGDALRSRELFFSILRTP